MAIPTIYTNDKGKFVKGNPGKPKGKPLTKDIAFCRQAFADILKNGTKNIIDLIERTAVNDPKGAVQLYLKLAEFIMPKLRETVLDIPTQPIVFQLPTFIDTPLEIEDIESEEV